MIRRWLYRTGPAFFAVPLSLGIFLALFTLPNGFFTDDYAFVAALEGATPQHSTPFGLYEFASGDPARTFELVRRGPFAWWTAPDLKLRFFRPLSSAFFAFDHAIFGHAPLGYHVDTVLVWAALLVAVGALHRLALGLEIAALGFVVFAIAGSHAEPVAWLASRHLLVAAAPSVAGLAAYVAHRERGFRAGRWLAVTGMLVGMLGGEGAIGVALYWIAYDCLGPPPDITWSVRWRRALLPVGLVLLYVAAYQWLGFGSAHNGLYLDPFSDLRAFAWAVMQRVPTLLSELLAGAPSGLTMVVSAKPFVVAGVVATMVVALLLRAVWPTVSASDRRALIWLGTGSLLSIVVSSGGFPGSRLLLVPSIGASAWIGTILRHGWARAADERVASWPRRAGVAVLFFIHVIAAPLLFLVQAKQLGRMGSATAHIAAGLDDMLGAPGNASDRPRDVFIVTSSDPLAGLYAGAARALRAPHAASSWNLISMAHTTHHITRTGANALVVRTEKPMLSSGFERVFRGSDEPLRAGDSVELDTARVTVLEATAEGLPQAIEVRFRSPIGSPLLCLLAWKDSRFVALDSLEVGREMTIAWSPGPTGLF